MQREYDYSQKALLERINTYYQLAYKKSIPQASCHGLAVLWLKRKFENCSHIFQNIVKQIVRSSDEELLAHGKEIETFYKDISLLQQAENQRFGARTMEEKNHALPESVSDGSWDQAELTDLFSTKIPSLSGVIIRSITSKKHTVTVYREGDVYWLFDANYKSGEPKKCSAAQLFSEINACFYNTFKLVPPSKIPMELELVTPRPRLIADYPKPLFKPAPAKTTLGVDHKDLSLFLSTLKYPSFPTHN